MKRSAFIERDYRRIRAAELTYYTVCEEQTDLMIGTRRAMKAEAVTWVKQARGQVEEMIRTCPAFLTSFTPLSVTGPCSEVARWMLDAARDTGLVGPMAAVAGAVAQYVGRRLKASGEEVIVENGGDVYLSSAQPRQAAIYAGDSPLSMKLGIQLDAGEWGICTSSGKIGPSVSFGRADAAVVVSHNAALADAAATALGNLLKEERDIPGALERICALPGVVGAVAVMGDKIGAAGGIRLLPLQKDGK